MPYVKLGFDDIEPMEKELEKCYRYGYSGFLYKGEFWDWRMAYNAVEDLKAIRDFNNEDESTSGI